jgi:hypothetical protein
MSQIFSLQLTAVATAVLAGFAIVTALFAGLAFRSQGKQFRLLMRQYKGQLNDQAVTQARQTEALARQDEQQRKAQASLVFMWQDASRRRVPHRMITAHVRNASDQPIYQATVFRGRGQSEIVGMILPGEEAAHSRKFPPGTEIDRLDAVLMFRDAAGIVWKRPGRWGAPVEAGR